MIKKLFTFLLSLFFLSGLAFAETQDQRLASIDIVSQQDARFMNDQYIYFSTQFYEQGCLPASICNALTAALAQPDTAADALLEEIILGLSDPRAPRSSFASVERLPDLLKSAAPGTAVAELTADLKMIHSSVNLLNADHVLQELAAQGSEGVLFLNKVSAGEEWKRLVELIVSIDEAGHGDARLAIASVGAGYHSISTAPFGSGENGHYIALYLEVGDFYRNGTFYLLDSLPRALDNETRDDSSPFVAHYPFVLNKYTGFNYNFDAHRISNTVVKFTLKQSEHDSLQTLLNDTTAVTSDQRSKLISLHARHMETALVFGVNQAILYIP